VEYFGEREQGSACKKHSSASEKKHTWEVFVAPDTSHRSRTTSQGHGEVLKLQEEISGSCMLTCSEFPMTVFSSAGMYCAYENRHMIAHVLPILWIMNVILFVHVAHNTIKKHSP
jgi:hypothetical protein